MYVPFDTTVGHGKIHPETEGVVKRFGRLFRLYVRPIFIVPWVVFGFSILRWIVEQVLGGETYDQFHALAQRHSVSAWATSLLTFAHANPATASVIVAAAVVVYAALRSEYEIQTSPQSEQSDDTNPNQGDTISEPPNLIVTYGRVKSVGLDDKLRWTGMDFPDADFVGAFIAEFSNQPHPDYHVGKASRVRAKVRLEAAGSTTADPAPWLNAALPDVSFESGDTRELILGILGQASNLTTGEIHHSLHGIRDLRHLTHDRRRGYEPTAELKGRVLATVTLTVDGMLKGPFRFGLDPGDPGQHSDPVCRPIMPIPQRLPSGFYVVRDWLKLKSKTIK
jgi:hypothetical protein